MITPPNTAGFLAEVADLGLSEASPPKPEGATRLRHAAASASER